MNVAESPMKLVCDAEVSLILHRARRPPSPPAHTGNMTRTIAFIAAAAAFAASSAAFAGPFGGPERTAGIYTVHALSAADARPAAWSRTLCGSYASKPQPDIVTQWGAQVTPDNAWRGADAYPRPQLVRPDATWTNLNGLWEFSLARGHVDAERRGVFDDPVPFGVTLNQTILVPFPLEACLSGAFAWPLYSGFLFYRLLFDAPAASADTSTTVTMLRFGAVDWNTTVYLNGALVGRHIGGYDEFSFDVGAQLRAVSNELILAVFDPSDKGDQPAGKQWLSAISAPGSVFYTPNSGVHQTVWLETVPRLHVEALRMRGDTQRLFLTVEASPSDVPGAVSGIISFKGANVTSFSGVAGAEIVVDIPDAQLWAPGAPSLYDLALTLAEPSVGGAADSVRSYFGMREVGKANFTNKVGKAIVRPTLNGADMFYSGVLDQRFWSDGIYSAPSDAALASDIIAMQAMGFNAIRGHQNYGSARWFYHADRLGMAVLQDMVGIMAWANGAINVTSARENFLSDFKRMVDTRYSSPSILQWTAFNEGDCVQLFDDVPAVIAWLIAYDPSRNVDTNSGGSANGLNIGDTQDTHDYPQPGSPNPNYHQFAMQGEYGGLSYAMPGHEWDVGKCGGYVKVASPTEYIGNWSSYVDTLRMRREDPGTSIAIYTQLTDTENECDGLVNYDRTPKFSDSEVAQIRAINKALIAGA